MGKWKNFKGKFKRKSKATTDDADQYIDISPSPVSPDKAPAPKPAPQKKKWFSKWAPGKRDRQIQWLQAGYSEMLTMMRGINEHLDRQEDVQHKMVDVLSELPKSMSNLENVGKAAEQQVEVLSLLREQMNSSVQHDKQLVESMNKFNDTLGVMDETSRNSGKTVAQLIERSKDADTMLRDVIERSERRFVLLTVLFLLAVILGVGAVLFSTTTQQTSTPKKPAIGEVADVDKSITRGNRPPKTVVASEDDLDATTTTGVADELDDEEEESAQPRRGFFQRIFGRRPAPAPETDTAEGTQ